MKHILLIILVCMSPLAKAELSFDRFNHVGTGCPQGSVAFSPAPDGQSASILFDEFMAQVPQYDGINDNQQVSNGRLRRDSQDPRIQHKACNLSFSVTIPEGQMVESLEVQIFNRGSTILDPGIRASLSTIFVGHNGLRNSMGGLKPSVTILERKIWGAMRAHNHVDVFDEWFSDPVKTIPIRSGCARQGDRTVQFTLKNHLDVEIMNNDLNSSGIIVMDSSDIQGSLRFKVQTRPCGHVSTPPPQSGGIVRPPRRPRRYR